MSHFEVENKLFIPAVEKLENNLRSILFTNPIGDQAEVDEDENPLNVLSEREKDIIKGVAQGMVNKEIADELCISIHTVATHRRNISSKLGIHSSAGLIIFAIINHLVDINEVKPI